MKLICNINLTLNNVNKKNNVNKMNVLGLNKNYNRA